MLRVPLKIILDNFNNFIHAGTLFDGINSQNIGFEDAEKMQMKFESKLSSERVGNNKSDIQQSEIENIEKFYKLQEKVIKFYNGDKAAYDVVKHGKGLKILTPKQMLQRLLIALA